MLRKKINAIYQLNSKTGKRFYLLKVSVVSTVCLVSLPFQTLHAEWVEFVNDASIEIIHNDNVNQSTFTSDMESDVSINPAYTFGRFYQVNDLTRLRLTLGLSANMYDDFDKLNSLDVKGSAVVLRKFGVGFNKPWVRGQLSLGRKEADVSIRDSDLLEVGLATGKRISDRLSGQLGIKYNKRDGGNGPVIVPGIKSDVFDIENTSVSLGLQYLLTERSQISASLTHLTGEFDSACTTGNVATVLANEDVKAITGDEVFGGCVYRLDGSSNALKLQYSYALGRYSSLNFGYEIRDGKADVLDYESRIWNASFMYSK